jgi:hypothetical protein
VRNDFFDNVDRLRLPAEQVVQHPAASQQGTPTRSKTRRIRGEFVRGPIPLAWLTMASKLPGKALAVAMAIWFESGRRRGSPTIILTTAILDRFAVGRKAKYRALKHLQAAGLIAVYQKPRRNPVVTILDRTEEPLVEPGRQERPGAAGAGEDEGQAILDFTKEDNEEKESKGLAEREGHGTAPRHLLGATG